MQTPATTLLATLIAATLTAACGDEAVEPEPTTPTTLTISPASATLQSLADTVRLTATVKNQHGHVMASVPTTWTSSDPGTATVDASGLVTAVNNGTATVTATASSLSGTATMTVEQAPFEVLIDPDSLVLARVGDTARVSATFRDANGHAMQDPEVQWQSADTVVATVDATGLVTAVANGMAAVSANAGSASGSTTVTVGRADTITLSPPGDTIATGDTLRLAATAFDENGHKMGPSRFSWTSSDASVLRVDHSGLVTAVAEGQATITAILGHARATAEITVWLPDRVALVALYNATDGPNWVDNTNWLTDAPLGEWYGVETDVAGRVVRINLSGRFDLSGPIPPELGNLGSLEALDLSGNNLSGTMPPQLGDLANLEDLNLSENALSGVIPSELGNLASLKDLDLKFNALSGAIPSELGDLANLEDLNLSDNALSGAIPSELGNLANLRWLFLGYNDLTGAIPPQFADLSKLEWLVLIENALSGALPQSFLQLDQLQAIYVGGQGVCVPGTSAFLEWFDGINRREARAEVLCNVADVAALESLYDLTAGGFWTESSGWLGDNPVGDWYGVGADSLGHVIELDLGGNGLTGRLPGALGKLPRMTVLRIANNALDGRLPLSLTALELDEFHYDGTDLCEPADADFQRWLDGIASRRGTEAQCQPLTERDILTALYTSTGGTGWTKRDGWLSGVPLGLWHGVEVDAQGRVVGLNLRHNNLSGSIPPELGDLSDLRYLRLSSNNLSGAIPPGLGGLSNLVSLYLEANKLSGSIPPELDGLANLRSLYLYRNELSGAIPPELGSLANLSRLHLDSNALSGAIPPELGGLANLSLLHLASNALSGAIPPELGDFANLRWLALYGNEISGAIPPELGGLSNLESLLLWENELSGAIPPELGELANLESLSLAANDLSGPLPPTFGGLTRLSELDLSHNGLAGAIPAGLSDLGLESLIASGTNLCVPREPAFEEWLATIPRRRIAACGEPPAAYLVQAVQSRAHPVPLVAGEDALLRVFATAAMETTEGFPEVRARFYLNGTERHSVDIAARSTPIPTEINEGDLLRSANTKIPGRLVRPGLEMVVEIDPGGVLDASLGVPKRIPQEGRLAVEVREMPLLDLTVIPFLWRSDPDSAIIGLVEGMAADPEGHALLRLTHVLLPVGDIDVTAHAPVVSTSNSAVDLLAQTEAIRVLEGGGGHYMGMMSGGVTGAGGVAYLGGRSSVSWPGSFVIAHELGHNMGLSHAPCGGADRPDPSFPYPNGTIGAWGYNFGDARLVPAWRKDLMSYCGPPWTSDYHFTNALVHRLIDEGASAAALAAAPARSLLLWGGIDATGTPFLHPAFVADTPPTLPDSAGDYTLTGRDAGVGQLFSLNFVMPEVADGDGGSSFVFALPVQPQWEDALASITLSGPDGTTTLSGDTDNPMAILRDPVTGHVRAFLSDLPPQTQAAMDAAERAVEPGLQVLFSRGIPDATEWRR